MSNLSHRQSIIQEKRKTSTRRNFVMEIASRQSLGIYKNKGIISRYPETDRCGSIIPIKQFDPNDISESDYSGNFYMDLTTLFQKQDKMALMHRFENENCDYAEVYGAKNAYLSFSVGTEAENICYSLICSNTIRNIYNSFSVLVNCDNIYQSRIISHSYNIFYSQNCYTCSDLWFCSNCIGCRECIESDSLVNQTYCIQNKQYSEEEYYKRKAELLSMKHDFDSLCTKTFSIPIDNKLSSHVSGAGIVKSQYVENGYIVQHVEHARNCLIVGGDGVATDCYDCIDVGFAGENFQIYGAHYTGEGSNHIYCSSSISASSQIYYSYFLESCSFCLGCIGLKNKSYCILNKQYTKEERYIEVDKIFGQMHADGVLSDFFPASMNPFYFNDTAAYLIDPTFTKEEVTAMGYLRRDEPIKVDVPVGSKLVLTSELDRFEKWIDSSSGMEPGSPHDGRNDDKGGQQRYIDPEILKYIIQDEQGNIYRVVKMEYDFLVKYSLPLPRKHWLDRMKENFRIKM